MKVASCGLGGTSGRSESADPSSEKPAWLVVQPESQKLPQLPVGSGGGAAEHHEAFDTFDLKRWRAECEAELREAKCRSKRVFTPRHYYVGLSNSPSVSSISTAVSSVGRPPLSAPSCSQTSRSRSGTAGSLGTPRSARVHPLLPKDSPWQWPFSGNNFLPNEVDLTVPELHMDERVRISEAVFSSQNVQTHSLCRDNIAFYMAAREEFVKNLARKKREKSDAVGQENREQAAEWRSFKADLKGKHEASVRRLMVKTATARASARRAVWTRCEYGGLLSELQGDRKCSGEGNGHNRLDARLEHLTTSTKTALRGRRNRAKKISDVPPGELEILQKAFAIYAKGKALPMEYLLRCLMELGLCGRTGHERWVVERMCCDMYLAIAKKRASVSGSTTRAEGASKALSKSPSRSTMVALPKNGGARRSAMNGSSFARKSLRSGSSDSTVRGSARGPHASLPPPSRRTRFVTDVAVAEDELQELTEDDDGLLAGVAAAISGNRRKSCFVRPGQRFLTSSRSSLSVPGLPKEAERVAAGKPPEQDGENGSLLVESALPNRTASESMITAECRGLVATFEDFVLEIVPSTRRLLSECRHDEHNVAFRRALSNSIDLDLPYEGFKTMANGLEVDQEALREVLTEFSLDIRKAEQEQAANSIGRVRVAEEFDEGPHFDFTTIHLVLMTENERTDRKGRRLERQIQEATSMSEDLFWHFRHEVARVNQTFNIFDADNSGFLYVDEVKMLLKIFGLEPFVSEHAIAVDNVIAAGSPGNQEISFIDLLRVMDQIRLHQKTLRRKQLHSGFRKEDTSGTGYIDVEKTTSVLKAIGLEFTCEKLQALVTRIIWDFDTERCGDINFYEMEALCQRVCEGLSSEAVVETQLEATRLGLPWMKMLQCLKVFDHFDVDRVQSLPSKEFQQALEIVVGRGLEPGVLDKVYAQIGSEPDVSGFKLTEFLRAVSAMSNLGILRTENQFTLRMVPFAKLRAILGLFRYPKDPVSECDEEQLVAVVSQILQLAPDDDLSTMDLRGTVPERFAIINKIWASAGVENVRQFMVFAGARAAYEDWLHGPRKGM